MKRSSKNLRSLGPRTCAALVAATLGMWLSVGATSAAAYKDVELTVKNQGSHNVYVSMCDSAHLSEASCPGFFQHEIAHGQSAYLTHHTVYGNVFSQVRGPGWITTYSFDFKAVNPAVGQPYISLYNFRPDCCLGTWPTQYALGEDEHVGLTHPLHVAYFYIRLYRGGDHSAKVMQIVITHVPNSR